MPCKYYKICEGKRDFPKWKQATMCDGPADVPFIYPFVDDGRIPRYCPHWELKLSLEEKAKPVVKDVLTNKELGIENQL